MSVQYQYLDDDIRVDQSTSSDDELSAETPGERTPRAQIPANSASTMRPGLQPLVSNEVATRRCGIVHIFLGTTLVLLGTANDLLCNILQPV